MIKNNKPNADRQREAEAQRIIERVERESETVATSSMARSSRQFGNLLKNKTTDQAEEDPIEILGKKIGRGLGLVAMVFLAIYLFTTYVLKWS